jgi:hypothetical protein
MRFQGTFLVQLNKFYEALLGKYPVSFVEYFLFYQACSCVADTGLGNPKFFFCFVTKWTLMMIFLLLLRFFFFFFLCVLRAHAPGFKAILFA